MKNFEPGISSICRKSLRYIVDADRKVTRYKPWLGDAFSFLYDRIMARSIFPKKFSASMSDHYNFLKQELDAWHGRRVLELAAGSGSAINFLPSDNFYTGTDISPGLLKQAAKRFNEKGFQEPVFYVVSAEDLPFKGQSFDLCLCILSLNFFHDAGVVLQRLWEALAPEGVFLCSVPVPERMTADSKIHGALRSERQLAEICESYGFHFDPLPLENGALLYFKARKEVSTNS